MAGKVGDYQLNVHERGDQDAGSGIAKSRSVLALQYLLGSLVGLEPKTTGITTRNQTTLIPTINYCNSHSALALLTLRSKP
jgi:hypothetical protein